MNGRSTSTMDELVTALREAAHQLAMTGAPQDDLARLAQKHSTADLVVAVGRVGGDASMTLERALAVELALRGKGLAPTDPLARSIERAFGPSAAPPWLLPIERRLPRFGGGDAGGGLAEMGPPPPLLPSWLRATAFTDVTSDVDVREIGSAVSPWVRQSNGEVEVQVFAIRAAEGLHVTKQMLRILSPRGVPADSPQLEVEPVGAPEVLVQLVSAAYGGAYGRTPSGMTARDLAWTSFRALVGASPDVSCEAVAREASECGFTQIRGTSFFYDVVWDLGLAVVNPARGRLALLFATDVN